MANNSISLVSLDFDTLKSQLKTYLKSQSQFTDYDFDGSNMSVLLDILTYNTHLNAFYLNMVASEMFMDSAQLRNSVVSIAKALNYTPRSSKSSRATVNLRFAQSNLTSFSIPENTRFTGKNSNGTFSFLTGESIVLYPSNGFFTANSVVLYEGSILTDTFVVNESIENQRYILTNSTVDTDSLQVTIIEDGGQTNTIFTKTDSIISLTANSNVFFLQAAEESRYEVVFGDNVFGRKPKNGAVISARYRITSGEKGTGATNFVLNDNLGAYNGYGGAIIPTITTVKVGFGGGPVETVDEIRYRAPRNYQVQERAITAQDFETLVSQNFQYIKSLHVYGGELSDPPKFGQVFVAPITFTGETLSNIEKIEIQDFLKDKTTLGITPIVVDSDYLYIGVECEVKFKAANTNLSAADIQSKVNIAIDNFNDEQLIDFNTEFKTSKFETAIDAADQSISSNDTKITLRKRFKSPLLINKFPTVNYRNAIVPGTITTSSFVSGSRTYQYTDYNPNNNTFRVQQVGKQAMVTNSSQNMYLKDITSPDAITYVPAGTVDYQNGIVALNSITVNSFIDRDGIDFFAQPVLEDVSSKNNDVITVDPENTVIVVRQI